MSKDHPRSRGVYERLRERPVTHLGSSPLARGLPPIVEILTSQEGIIPARAGFTQFIELSRSGNMDHPRSRGVYIEPPPAVRRGPGSSPLARGLPPIHPFHTPTRGIIPARAGFTGVGMCMGAYGWDHPRSRGVY